MFKWFRKAEQLTEPENGLQFYDVPSDIVPPVGAGDFHTCCSLVDGPATEDAGHREDLRELAERLDNCSGYFSKAMNLQAGYTVKGGPVLKITDNRFSPAEREEIYTRWVSWCKASGFAKGLYEIVRGANKSGEGLGKLVTATRQRDPVKLKVKSVACSRLRSPAKQDRDRKILDGIEFDDNYDPIKFFIAKDNADPDPEEVDAKDILYWFPPCKEEQRRGLPRLHSTLYMFPELKDWRDAVIGAHRLWAKMPMWLESDAIWIPGDDEYKVNNRPCPKDKPFSLPKTGNYIPTLPNGTKIGSRQGEAPGTNAREFRRDNVTEAVSPLCMPALLIMGDSGECSFSAANIDWDPWVSLIGDDRCSLEPVCTQVFDAWLIEGSLIPGYFSPNVRDVIRTDARSASTSEGMLDIDHHWRWGNVKCHMDPSKEADGRATDLDSGAKTILEIYAERNQDAELEWKRASDALAIPLDEYKRDLYEKWMKNESQNSTQTQQPRGSANAVPER